MLLLLGVNLWVIWALLSWGFGGDLSPEEEAQRQASQARAACVTFIRPQLNNPSSVEWVDRARWPVRIDSESGHLQVSVTFRATNALGGIVTERYICIARPTDDAPIPYRIEQ
jgi:hypothetical protein